MLVLDASTSMLEEVRLGHTKQDAAAEAAGRFIDLIVARPLGRGHQAGVVWFNDTAVLEQGLTDDTAALHAALERIVNRPFSRLDLGVREAHEELMSARRNPNNRPVIIVLTDGQANPEPVETAIEEAERAKGAGAMVFVVGLGNREALDDAELRQIASRPEYYYQTPDAGTLTNIYEEIAGVIPCPLEQFWGRR
jgi:Mg-chelatase subunit ChlD